MNETNAFWLEGEERFSVTRTVSDSYKQPRIRTPFQSERACFVRRRVSTRHSSSVYVCPRKVFGFWWVPTTRIIIHAFLPRPTPLGESTSPMSSSCRRVRAIRYRGLSLGPTSENAGNHRPSTLVSRVITRNVHYPRYRGQRNDRRAK